MTSFCVKVCRKIQSPEIETDECGKAKSFRLFSLKRPHMRSFHSSWFCFFVAFSSWFGIQPLLPTIRKELGLSKIEVANSGTASIAATIAIRILIGPLCDRYGPRKTMSGLLLCGAIPVALSGLIRDSTGLIILRLFVGILGGTFVPCQFWTTATFNLSVVGTANALVGGWGNLGGGFTFILMPGVFELVKLCGPDEFLAWKIAMVIPASICVITGISIIFTSDDCPQGGWKNRILPKYDIHMNADKTTEEKSTDGKENIEFIQSEKGNFKPSLKYVSSGEKLSCTERVWIVITIGIFIIQYGMCFGVEISVNTVMNLYLLYKFKKVGCTENGLSLPPANSTEELFPANVTDGLINATEYSVANSSSPTTAPISELNKCSILDQNTASLITSLFGLMNLFARALGGMLSDIVFSYRGIPGRLLMHVMCLSSEGIMLIVFSQMETIPSAVVVMILSSLFLQMSEGTTYALVPYTIPRWVGTISGLVGAGGNAGAFIWTSFWSSLVDENPSKWFMIIGIIVLSGSALTVLTKVQGCRLWSIFRRKRKT